MHRTSFVPRFVGWSSLFAMLTFCFAPAAAHAQQQQFQPVNFAQAPPEIQQNATTLQMVVGTSQTYMMSNKADLKKVENPNSKVLDVRGLPKSPNEVQLVAVGPGRTIVKFTDVKDRVEILEVIVISDRVKELREIIARTLPTAAVQVTSTDSGATVIVSGNVLTVDDLRALQAITGPGVINNVRIGGVQQVQLEVIVALVNRTEQRNMAFSWNLNGNNFFVSSVLTSPLGLTNSIAAAPAAASASLSNAGGANLPFGVVNNNGSFMGFLQALRTEGLLKIMSEPRVTTLSGRPAYIVSGGETPILTSSGQGAPSVSYKQFGTVVHFLPVVLGNGKIHLEVRPEISEIDTTLGINITTAASTTIVPGFRTRSAQVAVQVDDGQTVAIGGLIQNRVNATISRVPVLGDLPFLGVAFSSKSFAEEEQELIILVTPRLIDPVDCCKIPKYLPGRETRSADDFELFLEGIMEAPRGPRNVVFHPHLYKPAFHNSPNAGQIPCGDISGHGRFGGNGANCANGSCSATSNSLPPRQGGYTQPAVVNMPSPNFPDAAVMPASNFRVSVESEMPAPAAMPPMRTQPGLGPVMPTQGVPMQMPSGREFDNRPAMQSPGLYVPR